MAQDSPVPDRNTFLASLAASKLQAISDAATSKVAALEQHPLTSYRDLKSYEQAGGPIDARTIRYFDELRIAEQIANNKAGKERQAAAEEEFSKSLAGRLGGSPGGVIDSAAATSAGWTGNVLGAGFDAYASLQESTVDGPAKDAFNRLQQGVTTEADTALLAERPFVPGSQRSKDGGMPTNLERLEHALATRERGDAIRNTLGSLVATNPDTGEKTSGLQRRVVGDGALTAVKGAVGVPEAAVGLADIATLGRAGKLAEESGIEFKTAKEMLNAWMTPEQQYQSQQVQDADGFLDTVTEAVSRPSTILHTVGESIPLMLAGGLVGRGVQALGATGTVAAGIGEGAVMAGSAAEAIRQETQDGHLTPAQSLAAVGVGALGAGVGIGGAKVASKLGLADIDAAIVAGTTGRATRGPVSRTALSAGLEGGEELLQTSEETILQNVALGKPWNEDLGDNAAMGMLAGKAMGAYAGASQAAQIKVGEQNAKVDAKKVYEAAIQSGSVDVFLDPTSPTYDPSKAITATLEHGKLKGTPETQQAAVEQAKAILEEQKAQIKDSRTKIRASTDPKAKALVETQIAQLQTQLETVPVDSQEAVLLNEQIAHFTAISQLDEQQVADLTKDIAQREEAIGRSQTILDAWVTEQTRTGEVAAQFEVADSPAETLTADERPQVEKAVADVLVLAMKNPENIDPVKARALADNTANTLTSPQRTLLRTASDAREAIERFKTLGDVRQDVLEGKDGFKGLQDYQKGIRKGVEAGNATIARQHLTGLRKFATTHSSKSQAFTEAFNHFTATGDAVQLLPHGNGQWVQADRDFTPEQLRKLSGIQIDHQSAGLVESVREEAELLRTSLAASQAAYDVQFNTEPSTPSAPVEVAEQASAAAVTEPVPATGTPVTEAPVMDEVDIASQMRQAETQSSTNIEAGAGISAVTPQAAQQMSDEVLNDQLSELITKRIAGTVTEIEQATFDVLDNEMNVREDTAQAENDAADVAYEAERTAEAAPAKDSLTELLAQEEQGTQQEVEPAREDGKLHLTGEIVEASAVNNENYRKVNLIGTYLEQVAGQETSASLRPLVAVQNFVSQVKSGAVAVQDFLAEKLTEEQYSAIGRFLGLHQEWNAIIENNLTFKEEVAYRYREPMQYFLDENQQLEENVISALVASGYGWVVEAGTAPENKTNEQINQMVGQESDAHVTRDLRDLVGTLDVRSSVLMNRLGQRAVQSLGLKLKQDAPASFQSKLEVAMGAHVLGLLEIAGVVETVKLSSADIQKALGKDSDVKGDELFVRLVREGKDSDRATAQITQSITQAAQGSGGVFDNLFAIESAQKLPTLAPTKATQKDTANGRQLVPGSITKIHDKLAKTVHTLRRDTQSVLDKLSGAFAERATGIVEVDVAKVHKANRRSKQAKNDNLRREITDFLGFTTYLNAQQTEDGEVPFYILPDSWKNQRMGYGSTINMQTSKFHRFVMQMGGWVSVVNLAPEGTGDTALDNFKLRVMEGLDIKTDSSSNADTLQKFDAILTDPTYAEAVEALRQIIWEDNVSDNSEQAIINGVIKGEANMHSLDALIGLAHYQQAVSTQQPTFSVSMMGEVDGKTNGPMLSLWQMGNMDSETGYMGGFLDGNTEARSFGQWKPGGLDLYQRTAKRMNEHLATAQATNKWAAPIYAALANITGALSNEDGSVSSDGRNIVKNPITTLIYGSGLSTTVAGMADTFIDKIYERMESIADGKKYAGLIGDAAVVQLQADLNTLMGAAVVDLTKQRKDVPKNLKPAQEWTHGTVEAAMENELSLTQAKQLRKVFTDTIGAAMESVISKDFKGYMDVRKVITQNANAAYSLYDIAYKDLEGRAIQKLMTDGVLPHSTNKKGVKGALESLTQAQEKLVQQAMKDMEPRMHSMMSQRDGNLEAGLFLSKTERSLNRDTAYAIEEHFSKASGLTKKSAQGFQRVLAAPGVSVLANGIQSMDGGIMQLVLEKMEALGIHDAAGLALKDMAKGGRLLNKVTYEALLEYSLPQQSFEALERTVVGLAKRLEKNPGNTHLKSELATATAEMHKALTKEEQADHLASGKGVLEFVLERAKQTAFNADTNRLDNLSKLEIVDQYTLEAGVYHVSQAMRDKAVAMKEALTPAVDATSLAAARSLDAVIEQPAQTTAQEPAPVAKQTMTPKQIGLPVNSMDTELDAFLRDTQNLTAGKLMDHLRTKLAAYQGQRTPDFYRALLVAGKGILDPNIPIQYLTAESVGIEVPVGMETAFGWTTIAENGQVSITIRGSDFRQSAVGTELMLHELLHAMVGEVVRRELAAQQADGQYTSEALRLINEIDQMRKQTQAFVQDRDDAAYFTEGLTNVQEFISWGLTNTRFQRVLADQTYDSAESQTGNSLLNMAQAFISRIAKILFKGSSKSVQQQQATQLSVLMAHTAGLMKAAQEQMPNQSEGTTVLAQQGSVDTALNFTPSQVYDVLATQTDAITDPFFDQHLRGLLDGIVDKLHGPYQAFYERAKAFQAVTPLDVFAKAQQTGNLPYTDSALNAGVALGKQAAWMYEQVSMIVYESLSDNTTQADRELRKLYSEARKQIKPGDLDADPATGQQVWNEIFTLKAGTDMRTHLARFAGLGLTHQPIAELLQFNTNTQATEQPNTLFGKLMMWFEDALNWLNSGMGKAFGGQRADEKLQVIVDRLVDLQAKKALREINQGNPSLRDRLEDQMDGISDKARKALDDFGNTDLFQKSKSGYVRLVGGAMSTVAGERVELVVDSLKQAYERHTKGRQGLIEHMFTELRGTTDRTVWGKIMLMAIKLNEKTRKEIDADIGQLSLESFANKGKDLTKADKDANTAVLLRADVASLLGNYSLDQIQSLLNDPIALDQAISQWEAKLPKRYWHYFHNQTILSGYHMATGLVKHDNLHQNALSMAKLDGTRYVGTRGQAEVEADRQIIDVLMTLQALRYTPQEQKNQVRALMESERNRDDGGNGIEMVLKLHQTLLQDAKDKLFQGSESLMVKGYVPEVHNPHRELVVVSAGEVADYVAQGYREVNQLPKDKYDPKPSDIQVLMVIDKGMQPRLTGNISFTGTQAKGTRVHTGIVTVDSGIIRERNRSVNQAIAAAKAQDIDALFQPMPTLDPTKDRKQYMAPVFDTLGNVANYRYMMGNQHRDDARVLDRTNSFDALLGKLASSTFDKATTPEHNRKVVEEMLAHWQAEQGTNPEAYVLFGAQSTDPVIREDYRLLPDATKKAITEVWGGQGMMVRRDMYDLHFGYRKYSLAGIFDKSAADRNALEQLFVHIAEDWFRLDKKAALRVRQAEDMWQALVQETKDFIVVKSGVVLMWNIVSNLSLLTVYGVNPVAMARHHRIAFKGAVAWQKQSSELRKLEAMKATGMIVGTASDLDHRILELQQEMARNPVRKLIEAGMMPTIVEDVETAETPYSYKGRLARRTQSLTDRLPGAVKTGAKWLYMTHDTPLYKILSQGTQLSDFVARYALYEHMTTRKRKPLTHDEAVRLSMDAFVQYDVPSHKGLQYANDMGLVMFTKYYMRIQAVMLHMYRHHPVNGLLMLSLDSFFPGAQTIVDSAGVNQLGWPFTTGAFQFPDAATMGLPTQMLGGLFK